jgi:hypothetical protein
MCESVFKTAEEQQGKGMGTAWDRHGNGMVCVNPSLKRQRNSRGTAWERHGMRESVFKTAEKQQGNGMGTAW